MKSQVLFFVSIALALTACASRSMDGLNDKQIRIVVQKNMDRCVAEGAVNQKDLMHCTIDKMCCYTPKEKPNYTRVFDASTGKWLTGNAAATAIKRANGHD